MSTVVTLVILAGVLLVFPITLLVIAIVLMINFGRKKG